MGYFKTIKHAVKNVVSAPYTYFFPTKKSDKVTNPGATDQYITKSPTDTLTTPDPIIPVPNATGTTAGPTTTIKFTISTLPALSSKSTSVIPAPPTEETAESLAEPAEQVATAST